jgi:hypothetical protein
VASKRNGAGPGLTMSPSRRLLYGIREAYEGSRPCDARRVSGRDQASFPCNTSNCLFELILCQTRAHSTTRAAYSAVDSR